MATATITGRSASATRERMISVLDRLASGLLPPLHCGACIASLSDRCPDCAQDLADAAAVNAAIGAVEAAATGDEARAAYLACLLKLAETDGGRA